MHGAWCCGMHAAAGPSSSRLAAAKQRRLCDAAPPQLALPPLTLFCLPWPLVLPCSELLRPSASVALHRHSNALVDILPPEADSTISVMSQTERPDVTYQVRYVTSAG